MHLPLIAFALLPGAVSPKPATLDTAVFAGGCFWGVEAVFDHVKGVQDVISGYAGGNSASPSYADVGTGETGHAESVRVVYDPAVVSYATLMRVFFSVAHDATQLNRQGPDVGTQYRSAIFFRDEHQKKEAESYIAQLTKARYYPAPIVTEVAPLDRFYPAEEYHQDYMARHPYDPYIVYHDRPKLERLKKGFPELFAATG
jgi:peptide-methionine (S)-S-oxide reductase